jgi:hypothetical protein
MVSFDPRNNNSIWTKQPCKSFTIFFLFIGTFFLLILVGFWLAFSLGYDLETGYDRRFKDICINDLNRSFSSRSNHFSYCPTSLCSFNFRGIAFGCPIEGVAVIIVLFGIFTMFWGIINIIHALINYILKQIGNIQLTNIKWFEYINLKLILLIICLSPPITFSGLILTKFVDKNIVNGYPNQYNDYCVNTNVTIDNLKEYNKLCDMAFCKFDVINLFGMCYPIGALIIVLEVFSFVFVVGILILLVNFIKKNIGRSCRDVRNNIIDDFTRYEDSNNVTIDLDEEDMVDAEEIILEDTIDNNLSSLSSSSSTTIYSEF